MVPPLIVIFPVKPIFDASPPIPAALPFPVAVSFPSPSIIALASTPFLFATSIPA